MKKWEYRALHTSSGPEDWNTILKKIGEEGWELVAVTNPLMGWVDYYFKREVVARARIKELEQQLKEKS